MVNEAGCPMCAPEADAATGMVATNSVAQRPVIYLREQVSFQ